jgi:hypothetical protein
MKVSSRAPSPNTRITLVRDADLAIPHDLIWRRIEARSRAHRAQRHASWFTALVFFLICLGVQVVLLALLVATGFVRMALL